MMQHEQYREALLADPHSADPELREHREACAECRAYTDRLLKFEARLERAMRVQLPKSLGAPRVTPRWLAIAASLLLGVAVAGVYLSLSQRSLAGAVVAHMAGEPDAWQRTDIAVDTPALQQVLKGSKLTLKSDAGIVSYASSCSFRGHVVPHLVVQSQSGPVTVMVLTHEPVRKVSQFNEQGYRGTIVPVPGHGSIAVLMRDDGVSRAEVERIATLVDDSIVWDR